MSANDKQIAGSHYKAKDGKQHWDICVEKRVPYLIGCATKYLFRWKDKNGIQDLEKALHYVEKTVETYEFEHVKKMVEDAEIPSTVGVVERKIALLLFNFTFQTQLIQALDLLKKFIEDQKVEISLETLPPTVHG